MKLLRGFLASAAICIATIALAAPSASAAIALVNAGFETGNTTGWQGSGSVAQGYAGYTAPEGSYFGLVRSTGCPGEALEQEFMAAPGDALTGWAFFRSDDYLPYDDNGDVRVVIEEAGTDAIVFSSSVGEVGNGGATPWTRFHFKFQRPGRYAIRVRVDNGGDDCATESAIGVDMTQSSQDDDNDVVSDDADNCPGVANPDQLDLDGDGRGDACDADDDNDTFDDGADNCPQRANSAQMDTDADGHGDACDADDDNDRVADGDDNCPRHVNGDQADADADGQGDACDADDDNDTVADGDDNCRLDANAGQADTDADGDGDACDLDDDDDAVDDSADNCDLVANTGQSDNDGDRHGDACDADDDNDAVDDGADNCPAIANPDQRDDDHDGVGNACDATVSSNAGKATGGGWIRHDGQKLSFSVSAKSRHGSLHGGCTVSFRRTTIRCLDVDGYVHDAVERQVTLVGRAVIGATPTRYRIVLRDGDVERFWITTESGFEAGGVVVYGTIRIRQR